jgi:two-component system, NarL family, nitrate/nitrite response regulator NarL
LLNENSKDWEVCGEVDNGEDAVGQVTELLPDVILLDVSIPLLHGVTVAQIVKKEHPAVAVVIMSEQDISVLELLADAAGTPYYLAKSRLAVDLIPLLKAFGKTGEIP